MASGIQFALTLDHVPLSGSHDIPRCNVNAGDLTLTGVAAHANGAVVAANQTAGSLNRQGWLIWLDRASGKATGAVALGSTCEAAPAITENRVFAAAGGYLYAFDLSSAEPARGFPVRLTDSAISLRVTTPPLVAQRAGREPLIIVGAQKTARFENWSIVSAFDWLGRRAWPALTHGGIEVDAKVVGLESTDDRLIVAANRNLAREGVHVAAYTLESGMPVWPARFELKGGGNEGPALVGRPLIRAGRVFVTSRNGHIYALDLRSGHLETQSPSLGGPSESAPGWIHLGGPEQGVIIVRAAGERIVAWTPGRPQFDWDRMMPGATGRWLAVDNVDGDWGVAAPAAGGRLFAPWHGGDYAAGAQRMEQAGRMYEAGGLWHRAGQREEAAIAFERAGKAWRGTRPMDAAHAYSLASRLRWELEEWEDGRRCGNAAAECAGLALVRPFPLTETFTQFKPETFTLALRNFGSVSAAAGTVWLRLHGDVSQPIEGVLSEPIAAGSELSFPFSLTPTLTESQLRVDIRVDTGHERIGSVRTTHIFHITATPAPQPQIINGDIGKLNIQLGAGAHLTLRDAGLVRMDGSLESLHIEHDLGAYITRART